MGEALAKSVTSGIKKDDGFRKRSNHPTVSFLLLTPTMPQTCRL
jgi:hypothetical protein